MNQTEWKHYNNWYEIRYNPYNYYIPPHKKKIKKKNMKIENFNDLIKFCNNIDYYYVKNIDIGVLRKMRFSLNRLDNMIGLDDIKEKIFYQLIFFLQRLDNVHNDMLHTIIEGEPGLGKTELAKILADIYCCLRNFNKFHSLKRSDLVGEYLGQTAVKTQKKLKECLNGVVFIDEAYSLGNDEKKDSYSKEAIDTLTSFLSENKQNIIVIIAGYKDDLNKCFFNYNKGLERRFPMRFNINKYSAEDLNLILKKFVTSENWQLDDKVIILIKENYELFKFMGGDMMTIFKFAKEHFSLRLMKNCLTTSEIIKKLTYDDFKYAVGQFKSNKDGKEKIPQWVKDMYV